jgi:uracil-DNA glycosylase
MAESHSPGLDPASPFAPDWAGDPAAALALLAWQVEVGADEALAEAPIDRFALSAAEGPAPRPTPAPSPASLPAAPTPAARPDTGPDWPAQAATLAAAAPDLAALAEAFAGFEGCDLKRGARSFVFADGTPAARVMIVGEGPGAEEDRAGLPFVGPAGQMLDRMFAAIGLRRDHPDPGRALYITNSVPWRPPGNRQPSDDEIALCRPFLLRHVELAAPALVVAMGNAACQALLGRQGITRMRGAFVPGPGMPVLPMFHPSALLRRPEWKREAWADLLTLQARLRQMA